MKRSFAAAVGPLMRGLLAVSLFSGIHAAAADEGSRPPADVLSSVSSANPRLATGAKIVGIPVARPEAAWSKPGGEKLPSEPWRSGSGVVTSTSTGDRISARDGDGRVRQAFPPISALVVLHVRLQI